MGFEQWRRNKLLEESEYPLNILKISVLTDLIENLTEKIKINEHKEESRRSRLETLLRQGENMKSIGALATRKMSAQVSAKR